jgi:vacuolar-type H+-ATPase subunit F/Vma7
MAQKKEQRAIVIGKAGTITGLRMFGFYCMEIEESEASASDQMNDILDELERERPMIGMVLLTSDIEMNERQLKKFRALELPSITIPMHADQKQIAADQMEQLIEKAVGMKLNFLK